MDEERLIVPEHLWEDGEETVIRPRYFHEYTGQDQVKENLEIFVKAALGRGEALDHVLLYGPPGLGKNNFGGGDCQ